MDGYRSGITGPLLDYTVKKYRGHRAIPENIPKLLNDLASSGEMNKPSLLHYLAIFNDSLAAT